MLLFQDPSQTLQRHRHVDVLAAKRLLSDSQYPKIKPLSFRILLVSLIERAQAVKCVSNLRMTLPQKLSPDLQAAPVERLGIHTFAGRSIAAGQLHQAVGIARILAPERAFNI